MRCFRTLTHDSHFDTLNAFEMLDLRLEPLASIKRGFFGWLISDYNAPFHIRPQPLWFSKSKSVK